MAGQSVESLFSVPSLLGQFEVVKKGIPNPLPKAFMTRTQSVVGDVGQYTLLTGTRKTARVGMYGSPSRQTDQQPVGVRPVKLLHSIESQMYDPNMLIRLRRFNTAAEFDRGKDWLNNQTTNFMERVPNLKIAQTMRALVSGTVYFNRTGDLLTSSSGSEYGVDFGIPANNQNQLNGIIDLSWDNPAANIPAHIRKINQNLIQTTGMKIKYALCGINVPSYIAVNDYVRDWSVRNMGANSAYLNTAGGIQPGLFDLTWIDASNVFYEDKDGTVQTIIGDNQVIFFPGEDEPWWDMLEGSYFVPTNLNVMGSAQAAMSSLTETTGDFAYCVPVVDPVTIKLIVGTTFLFVIKNGAVVYQATVKF